MATKKAKPAQKSVRKKPQVAKAATTKAAPVKKKVEEAKIEEPVVKTTIASGPKKKGGYGAWMKSFFSKKYDINEGILTIFKSPRIYGALLAEIFGVMLLTIFFMAFGVLESIGMNVAFQLNLQVMFIIVGVTIAVFGISGANLNPIITAGMMATRRMSVIRGVLYMLAQVIGAWIGLFIVNGFYVLGGDAASEAVQLPVIKMWDGNVQFWLFALLAFVSAVVLGYFFAQAQRYKKSAFTFAFVVGLGVLTAMLVTFALQTSFFDYPATYNLASNIFTFNNPAIALMYNILPSSGANFGDILGQVGLVLSVFVFIPALGSICGFYFSDATSKLADEKGEILA